MNLVLDASVAVKFYVPEIYENEASKLLDTSCRFHAPELIYPEFASVIWKKERTSELTSKEALKITKSFLRLDLITHSNKDLVLSALAGAETTGQTVYDWTYLALAISLSCRFVTADNAFYESIGSTVFRENMLWIGDV